MISICHDVITNDIMNPKVFPEGGKELTDEEKREIVLNDPKFGMFSLMKHFWKYKSNDCVNVFGRSFILPILVFVGQWLMYLSVVIHSWKTSTFECKGGQIQTKLLTVSVSLVYFVNSFGLWDRAKKRITQRKVAPPSSSVVMLDAFQEHAFSLTIMVTNLYIVFVGSNVLEGVMNSLAMNFLSELDNEFEESYFADNLEEAVYIYDHVFVTQEESKRSIDERMKKSCLFCVFRYITWIPFKFVNMAYLLLPIYCGCMVFIGAICK